MKVSIKHICAAALIVVSSQASAYFCTIFTPTATGSTATGGTVSIWQEFVDEIDTLKQQRRDRAEQGLDVSAIDATIAQRESSLRQLRLAEVNRNWRSRVSQTNIDARINAAQSVLGFSDNKDGAFKSVTHIKFDCENQSTETVRFGKYSLWKNPLAFTVFEGNTAWLHDNLPPHLNLEPFGLGKYRLSITTTAQQSFDVDDLDNVQGTQKAQDLAARISVSASSFSASLSRSQTLFLGENSCSQLALSGSSSTTCTQPLLDESGNLLYDELGNIVTNDVPFRNFLLNDDAFCSIQRHCESTSTTTIQEFLQCQSNATFIDQDLSFSTERSACTITFPKGIYACTSTKTADVQTCNIYRDQTIRAAQVKYSASVSDLSPYCGTINTLGLRQFFDAAQRTLYDRNSISSIISQINAPRACVNSQNGVGEVTFRAGAYRPSIPQIRPAFLSTGCSQETLFIRLMPFEQDVQENKARLRLYATSTRGCHKQRYLWGNKDGGTPAGIAMRDVVIDLNSLDGGVIERVGNSVTIARNTTQWQVIGDDVITGSYRRTEAFTGARWDEGMTKNITFWARGTCTAPQPYAQDFSVHTPFSQCSIELGINSRGEGVEGARATRIINFNSPHIFSDYSYLKEHNPAFDALNALKIN